MILQLFYLCIGIALILWGADKFTDGASAVARRLRVSELLIGLTVVAFGTSLPEFIVSLLSAARGSADMSVGNIFGSNLFNTLVIVGASALVVPMHVERVVLRRDLPTNVLFTLAITMACFVDLFCVGEHNVMNRWEGAALLLLFLIYMGYTVSKARGQAEASTSPAALLSPLTTGVYLVLGIACLVAGGELLVSSAATIARACGISETIIGLTILAGGTSLPELATSIVAARKGSPALAIGNAVGSNLFNIGFVLATCACVRPLRITGINFFDAAALILSAIVLCGVVYKDRLIKRWEGLLLVCCYIVYLAVKLWS